MPRQWPGFPSPSQHLRGPAMTEGQEEKPATDPFFAVGLFRLGKAAGTRVASATLCSTGRMLGRQTVARAVVISEEQQRGLPLRRSYGELTRNSVEHRFCVWKEGSTPWA